MHNVNRSQCRLHVNPLEYKGIIMLPGTSNNMKFVHWPWMGGLLHLVQRDGRWAGRGRSPRRRPLPPIPNVTAHPPINGQCTTEIFSVVWYNGPLLRGFNVPINPLRTH